MSEDSSTGVLLTISDENNQKCQYTNDFQSDWSPAILQFKEHDFKKVAFDKKKTVNVDELISKSNELPIQFPVNTIRCIQLKNTVKQDVLEHNINSTYPLIHEGTLNLYSNFLEMKRKYGSVVEKNLYKDMDILELVQRLLQSRAMSFWGPGDVYLLKSKHEGHGKWETIGSDDQTPPLILEDAISYDEIKLSAHLYVTGYTQFINDGFRKNSGVPATNKNDITENGVIIGLIGARLKKKHVMEYQDIIITKEQNAYRNGYGPPDDTVKKDSILYKKQKLRQLWANFYGEPSNLYNTVAQKVTEHEKLQEKHQYNPAKAKDMYFDQMYYKKRLILTIDTLLLEANHRAKTAGKMAYIHMVGIGLGVWRNADHQEATLLDVFSQRLTYLKECVRHISDIHFAYFQLSEWNKITNGNKFIDKDHPNGGVVVHISKREPASKLTGPENENKLLIVSYAWDGNAQPGNEFWMGKVKSSGDSAAASCCQVSELHNSLINCENVNAKQLHIASRNHGILHISDYLKKLQEVS